VLILHYFFILLLQLLQLLFEPLILLSRRIDGRNRHNRE